MFGWDTRPDRLLPRATHATSRTPRVSGPLALRLLALVLVASWTLLTPAPFLQAQEAGAVEPATQPLTLDAAVALALEAGPERRAADLKLELAHLDYEQAKANHLVNPSPVSLRQSESAWGLAQAEHAASAGSIAVSVEEAYYGLIRSLQQVELSRGNLDQVRRQLDAAQARYDAGALAELDLRQTRQQAAQAENQLQADLRALASARQALNRLLGRPLDAPVELAESELTFAPVALDLDAALETALERRLEVIQARDRVETARLNLELAENPYTPRLEQERRRLELRQAEDGLAQALLQVEVDVRRAYDAVRAAEAQVPLRQQAAELAEEQLRIARLRFEAGTITSLDVTEAQQKAFEARVSALNAVFDYRISLAGFYQAARMDRPGSDSVMD